MLSHGINIDEEELVALLIEGVPNQMQRNQARAFAEVELPKINKADRKMASVKKNSSTLLRCLKCNSKGH